MIKVAEQVSGLVERCRPVTEKLAALAGLHEPFELGYYYHPDQDALAIVTSVDGVQTAVQKRAQLRQFGLLSRVAVYAEQSNGPWQTPWIKVAYSPGLRRTGELLNFFPGQYPGGIPNYPNPLVAMLTTGALGAGLGYAGGKLIDKALPGWVSPTALARLGGVVGAVPGATWGGLNMADGKSFLDSSLLNHPRPKTWEEENLKEGSTLGSLKPINMDALGRVIWDDPTLSAPMRTATMAVVGTAERMPGGEPGSGWVTPSQMGRLAAGMGAGYASGALVGGTLGLLTGMSPDLQSKLRQAGLYAGIISTLIPRMFQ